MNNRKKILIDTDIGDDIDDAFALLCAMALDFEIVGITTVFRDTVRRAGMAKKLLHAFGHGYENVPVYAGYSSYGEEPVVNNEHRGRFSDDLLEYAPGNSDPEEAAELIIRCCREYGKDLTVIALGPFCNIARVIEKDPQALGLAQKVVIMGGAFFKQYADWNVMCDVPAADVMFRELNNLECIGADVTHRLICDGLLRDILSAREDGSSALDYIRSLYRDWHADYPQNSLVLHDVLVIYYVLDPSICTMSRIRAAVITQGYAKGFTLNIDAYSKAWLNEAYEGYDMDKTVLAASDVDIPKFEHLIRRNISRCLELTQR